jgi:hypothetical protein
MMMMGFSLSNIILLVGCLLLIAVVAALLYLFLRERDA